MTTPHDLQRPISQKFRITIAYDGTAFSGWQIQPHQPSIQGTIENALFRITEEQQRVVGSGRTDAGVHATGQVAHFFLNKRIDPPLLKKGLNALLPPDIRIIELDHAPDEFHAQYSASGKEYHYHLCLNEVVLPCNRLYVWHYRRPISVPLLEQATQLFIGEHDFRGFSNALGGGLIKQNTIRTIHRIQTVATDIGLRLEFVGNGFLYKMVRNIVGMLVSIASQERPLEDIQRVLSSHQRSEVGNGAPPQGLFLVQVFYPHTLVALRRSSNTWVTQARES